ncbi:MAG TPA: hypothetical protein VKM55_04370 [Candidatus Lokiarchaeia archaeon]|nr:hypothetical protein [Candidatus Lokiarchaeia archaeon]
MGKSSLPCNRVNNVEKGGRPGVQACRREREASDQARAGGRKEGLIVMVGIACLSIAACRRDI